MKGFGKVEKVTFILSRAASRKKVLHVGCTTSPKTKHRWENGNLLHKTLYDQSEGTDQELVGIDIDCKAVEWLQERMPQAELITGDAHALESVLGKRKFDMIIAADVIEHLPNPGMFLKSCRHQMAEEGELLITTVNTYNITRFAKTFLFHEAVHPDHMAYYSHKTLRALLGTTGFRITTSGYYAAEPLSVNRSFNRLISIVLEGCTTVIWPQHAEGVVVTARPESGVQTPIDRE